MVSSVRVTRAESGARAMNPYYSDEFATLYHGDALDLFTLIADRSVDVVILDPPYSMVPNAVRGRDDGAAGTSGSPMRLLHGTANETRRVLRPGGIAPIVCDWRRVPDVSYVVSLSGLRLATTVAWTRTTVGTGGLFRSAWDPILIASSGSPEPVDNAAIRNVIEANPPGRRTHPYEKPVKLWQHILGRVAMAPVVLDPFAGSCASADATRLRGGRWIGFEVDERHCETGALRLQNLGAGLDWEEAAS